MGKKSLTHDDLISTTYAHLLDATEDVYGRMNRLFLHHDQSRKVYTLHAGGPAGTIVAYNLSREEMKIAMEAITSTIEILQADGNEE